MTRLDYTSIKEALVDWPNKCLPEPDEASPALLNRLRQILEPARIRGSFASLPDLMVLLREMLISKSAGGENQSIVVPLENGWPSVSDWKMFGLNIVSKSATRAHIEAEPWRPEWLGSLPDGQGDVFIEEHLRTKVRRDMRIPMDPFMNEVTGFGHYLSPGQREALLSSLFMPSGDTLIVNLPTGSGKTLLAQAPIMLWGYDKGLTLVIVPTNALALDLERRTQELLQQHHKNWTSHELAWLSSLDDDARDSIKKRIRNGSQGILFASPESTCGTLLPSLYSAAEKGLISYFVVDEAHLIAQWGDAFRPAFQQLSGVRRGLINVSPKDGFKTLLLSATFSPRIIETLESLFGPKDKLQMVSALHLRPEPRYLSCPVPDAETKKSYIEQLIRFVPRPFILYTTTRKDAQYWFNRLRDMQFHRVSCIHGETGNSEREKIIDAWVRDQLDGIVATSAFGVGMDKSDVRTVIHATVPESLDRFYQEVGRGGRDGLASLSITVFEKRDIDLARNMAIPTLIGDERGYERWSNMYSTAQRIENDSSIRLVDLNATPSGLVEQSEYNRNWNMRTLIMLARLGLIQLESARPVDRERLENETEQEYMNRLEEEYEKYFTRIPLRSLDPKLMDRSYFEKRLAHERSKAESSQASFSAMMSALNGKREMAEVLVELFASANVMVSSVCRGCPQSGGGAHEDGLIYQIPTGVGISKIALNKHLGWNTLFSGVDPSFVPVMYSEETPVAQFYDALKASVSVLGIQELVIPEHLIEFQPKFKELHVYAPDQLLVINELEKFRYSPSQIPLARATILETSQDVGLLEELLLMSLPLNIVFFPENLPDPFHPLRLYRDTSMVYIRFEEFLRKVFQ